MREIMNSKEAAEYLCIKERKLYELISERAIPCSKVGGKWIFPRFLIDRWILQNAQGPIPDKLDDRPQVIAGSHDPLLEWAVRETGTNLALMFKGSQDGLNKFAYGKALATGTHILDAETDSYNLPAIIRMVPLHDLVVIQWAWRRQGLILSPQKSDNIDSIRSLVASGGRFIGRQSGAGSQILLDILCAREGVEKTQISFLEKPARTESDVATAIANGHADAGLGIESVARQYNLRFLPLQRERYDLVLARRDFFSENIQALMQLIRQPEFAQKATELGGYDIACCGQVEYNGP